MPEPLTPRQHCVLTFICGHVADRGFSPTYESMAEELGIKSKSEIHRVIKILAAKGWVKHYPARARGIKILHHPEGAVKNGGRG